MKQQIPQLTRKEQAEHIDTLNEEIKHLREIVDINLDLGDDVISEKYAKVALVVIACVSLALNIVAAIGLDKVCQ